MPLMAVNGIRLNVAAEGEGAPLIVLHGLGSTIAALSAEIAHFRPHRRVVAYDARGHGASDRPAHYTMDDHIADVFGVMDSLGIERCALLGRSMGSYIAQGAACAVPGRFSHLVLAVPRAHAQESTIARLRRQLSDQLRGQSREMQNRILLAAMLGPAPPARKAALLAALTENAPEPLSEAEEEAAMAAAGRFDFRPVLPGVTARTLVMSGRHDPLNPPAEGALIASLIPGARHVILENSGHLPATEERQTYLTLITRFLEK